MEKIIALGLKVRKWTFFRIIRRTFAVLFPFILIGSFSQVIEFSILYPDGFLGNLLKVSDWLPHYQAANQMFGTIYLLTAGVTVLLAAGVSAKYTAQFAYRDPQLASLTGILVFLAICYQKTTNGGSQFSFRLDMLGFPGLILGIFVGYGVGLIFKLLSRPKTNHVEHEYQLLDNAFKNLLPLLFCLLLAVGLNILIGLLFRYQVIATLMAWLQDNTLKQDGFLAVMFFATLTLLMSWLGLSGPYTNNIFDSDPSAMRNMTYALSHQNDLANVPDKLNANTLYYSYGMLGGTGATLGLILAIFLVARLRNGKRMAYWTVLPSIFNINEAFMIGLPLLFNPFYLLPFLVIPLFNMVIGALVILLGIVPPAVYPVLPETPGILYGFIGTNGSWAVLVVSILLLICDILLYIPFVRFAEKVTVRFEEELTKIEGN